MFDGNQAYHHSGTAPVYAPNSLGRESAQEFQGTVPEGWEADGEMVRQAYALHAEDDDFGQAGTLVREVFDDAARDRLVDTVSGALTGVLHLQVKLILRKNVRSLVVNSLKYLLKKHVNLMA